jgi:zinc finger SWIM domain-containing protein 3
MTGIPCAHAVFMIWYFNTNPKDYVDEWYTIEMYKKAYDEIVYSMPGEARWVRTSYEHVDPPLNRIQPVRPRKVRRRGPEEPVNQNRIRKGGVIMRCNKCRGVGHNTRTCPRNRTKAVNYKRSRSSRRNEVNRVLYLADFICWFTSLLFLKYVKF